MTNQSPKVVYIPFDPNKGTAHEHLDRIGATYGGNIDTVEELQNSRGILKEFKVTLRNVVVNQFRVQS